MNSNSVKIVEVNKDTWYDCCQLEISDDQKAFIESNAVSIAQSKFQPSLKPFAIYYENKVVGFLMYNTVPEELDAFWVYRIMVDKSYQGKGIGKTATTLMIEGMIEALNVDKIVVGYHPENKGAHHLYSSLGFVDQGDRFGREMAVVKNLK